MATGQAHRFNVLKYKMLAGLLHAYPRAVTVHELADIIDVDANNIRVALHRWRLKKLPFIRCYKKKAYHYRITKSGIKAYLEYKTRVRHGLTLNRLKKTPNKVTDYMTTSYAWNGDQTIVARIDTTLDVFHIHMKNLDI